MKKISICEVGIFFSVMNRCHFMCTQAHCVHACVCIGMYVAYRCVLLTYSPQLQCAESLCPWNLNNFYSNSCLKGGRPNICRHLEWRLSSLTMSLAFPDARAMPPDLPLCRACWASLQSFPSIICPQLKPIV